MWPLTIGETWPANILDRHPAAAVRSDPTPLSLLRSCKNSEARSSVPVTERNGHKSRCSELNRCLPSVLTPPELWLVVQDHVQQ
jgi:hypothetical protein